MSFEACPLTPCPILKTTGVRLPQQPYRCYNCERRRAMSSTSSSRSSDLSYASSTGSNKSSSSISSIESTSSVKRPYPATSTLPGVARQPASAVQYCRKVGSAEKPFTFTCSSSSHYPVSHYASLPSFLPHQDHACPPCQLENLRRQADQDALQSAKAEYPHLKAEQLVKNGRRQDEWQGKMTLERYVDDKRQEEKEVWLHITRKWTQDLRVARVLVAQEDGLGLFP